jgi:hypothetical protein
MEKFIVVRVCKGGGGGISPTLTKDQALKHFNNWSDEGNAPHNIFVKVFDNKGLEYQVKGEGEGQYLYCLGNPDGWDF